MIDFEKIGKYKVAGKLGQGSFGVVYKGRDAYLKRDVAIKVCSVEDEGLRKRFFREAEISGKLVHKNIVTVYEFGFENDIPYLVQEMLSGEDMNRLVKRREPLAPAGKLEYLLQVANGLAYAHSEGVIHRDIKPGNIRVLEDGLIKIMDFGIAKLASAETQLTQKGVTMGTASYLPPEQVRGAELDHRADIFSFGVLAYELLTYERPFRGNTLSALIYQILYKVPVPMTDVWAECPAPLSDLIAKCLEKKPERRFASFAELIPELTAIREDVVAGKWPDLMAATPAAEPPPQEPSDVMSQAALAQTARGVLEGKVGDYTISTAVSPEDVLRPSEGTGRSTRPIEAKPAETSETEVDAALKTRILEAPPTAEPAQAGPMATAAASFTAPPADRAPDEDSEELTLKAREIIDLVAEGKLEAEAAKEQLEATFSRKDLDVAPSTEAEPPQQPAPPQQPTRQPVPQQSKPPEKVKPAPPPTPAPETRPIASQAKPPQATPAVQAPSSAPDAAKSDTYKTVFRSPLGWLKWAGAAAAVLLVAIVGWIASRDSSPPEPEPVETPPPPVQTVAPPVIEPSMGAVAIQAPAPWAQLTEITDAQGYLQDLPAQIHTPLYLELPPGQYKIHLQNPEGTEIQTCDVEVALETVTSCAPEFTQPSPTDYFKEAGWWE